MNFKIEGAIIGVGMMMLERIPRGLLVTEATLEGLYEPALQEFKDDMNARFGFKFVPPADFRMRTVDHVTWYLEQKGYLK
jgi:hypothetical protein